MSWRDSIDNGVFSITTGDGQVYKPMLKITETSKEYNVSTFEFISKPGTFVHRRKAKGRKFPLLFYFQGANNIADADAFDKSSDDSRPWTIKHPFYGNIVGQPLGISRNDNNFNSTEITVDFWETILDELPAHKMDALSGMNQKVTLFRSVSAIEFSNKVNLKPADVVTVASLTDNIGQNMSGFIDGTSYQNFINIKNEVVTKVASLIDSPVQAILSVSDYISIPSELDLPVSIRTTLLSAIYEATKAVLKRLIPNNKAIFESAGGSAVMAMAKAILIPKIGDYVTRSDCEQQASVLITMYEDYLNTIDGLYVPDIDFSNKFSAGQQSQTTIRDAVILSLDGLMGLAFGAKQERIVMLDRDTNLILLAHKYMGLDVKDENIERFRAINNIRNKKLFSIKKGTPIKYYV